MRGAGQVGFTLLELLAVLALLGVAAAIAWPSPPPTGGAAVRLRTAGSNLIAALIEAREAAMRDGRTHCLALGDPLRAGGCVAVPPSDGVVRVVTGGGLVRFHGDGSGTPAEISLTAAGLTRVVHVVGATGQILLR